MLVLTRRSGENVVFPNDDITVRVLEVKGNKVRLGFEAQEDTTILREEIVYEVAAGAADGHR